MIPARPPLITQQRVESFACGRSQLLTAAARRLHAAHVERSRYGYTFRIQTEMPNGKPHRNQGLFSDHYLNVTLPARPDWMALVDEAGPVMKEIAALLDSYTPSENEAQLEEELVHPILRLLGHTFEVQPALATPEGTKARR